MSKRMVSFILSICMIISLAPGFSLVGAESPVSEQLWTFGYDHTYTSDQKTAQTRYTFENFKETSSSLPWAFVDACIPKGYGTYAHTTNTFFKIIFEVDEGKKISHTDGYFAAATFALKVPEGGKYIPEITLGAGSSLTQVDAYLMKKTEFEAISGDTYKDKIINIPASSKLTTVDTYDSSVVSKLTPASLTLKSAKGETKNFEADAIYYLTLVSNEPEGEFRLSYDTESKVGKNILNMCLRSFELTSPPVEYEKATRPLRYNISADSLTSTALSDYGVSKNFSNANLAYVSWKSKLEGKVASIDPAKTDGFELQGRSPSDNSPNLYSAGFWGQFRIFGQSNGGTKAVNYTKAGNSRPHYAIRLNIPCVGEYRITARNDYTLTQSNLAGILRAYENKEGFFDQSLNNPDAFDTGAVTQVYFGKAPSTAYAASETDGLISGYTKLSLYDSGKLDSETELGTVTVTEPGEYYVIFNTEQASLDANSKAYVRYSGDDNKNEILEDGENWTSATWYQTFLLSNITLTPTDLSELSSVELEFDDVTNTVSIKSAKMSTGADADLTNARITFSITDSDKIQIDAENGKVTPCMEKVTATVSVTVTLDGKSVIATIPITVKALEYSDFYLKYDFAVTSKTARLDTAVTEEMTKGFWMWGTANRKIPTLNATSQYLQLGTYKNDWVALKLNIPVAGIYRTKLTYGVNAATHTGAGTGKLYVLPGNTTDIKTAIENSETLGEVNFKGEGSAFENGKEKELSNVTFDAPGEYYLVFSALGYTDNAHNMYPTSIEFIGGDKLAPVSAFTNKDDFVIEEGEADMLSVDNVYLSDCSETNDYEVSYKSSNNSVATVDESGNITGVSSGDTTVTASVSYNGTTVKRTVSVSILPKGSSKYTVVYDLAENSDFENATYANTYNFWKYVSDSEIEINVPVSGRYNIDTGVWNGMMSIEGNTAEGYYTFPEAGKYTIAFYGEGHPQKITLKGGNEIAPMGIAMSIMGTVASADELVMSDGSRIKPENLEIYYSIDDFAVAAIDEVSGKILPGKNGGKTTVRASVKYNGFTVDGEILLDIQGKDIESSGAVSTYSFNTASDLWKLNNHTSWDDKYGGATTWKIYGITYTDTDGWAWHMASDDAYSPKASMWTASGGVSLKPGANKWVAIKLKIPSAGRYWATLVSSKSYADSYGSADIFVIPLSDDKKEIESALTAENFIATLNCNDSSLDAAKAVTDELGAVDFEAAGDYLIVFKDKGQNKTVIPRILTLSGSNSVRYADFKLPKSKFEVGERAIATVSARLLDGTELTDEEATFVYRSSDENVATFIDGEIEIVGAGTSELTFVAFYGSKTVTLTRTITAVNNSPVVGVELIPAKTSECVGKSVALSSRLVYEKGFPMRLKNSDVIYEITEGDGTILNGAVTSDTVEKIRLVAKHNDYISDVAEVEFKEGKIKEKQTYYTSERVATAKENISKYAWAKKEYNGVIAIAEKYLPYVDTLYNVTVGKGLPRSYTLGYRNDPDYVYCRYCGANVEEGFGGFTYNLERPWKIQCPSCRRLFPSNDFELLYERGLVNGNYDVNVARQKNAEAVANGEKDALVNDLYPELWKDPSNPLYNKDPRTGDIVDGKMWGVDDGWGYHTGRTYPNGVEEVHTYISYFAYKIPNIVAYRAQDFAEAYLFTGDKKYGRAGAILLDRTADVYPEAFTNEFFHIGFATGGGGDDRGKFTGRIGDAERADIYALAVDGLFDYLKTEDPQLVKYLSAKADEYNLENKKRTWQDIWSNWADNLLWESFEAIKTCHLLGNTGYHQSAAAGIMLVLDEEPRSSEILDWIYTGAPTYGNGTMEYNSNPGGNVAHNFLELIDRDGMGNEAAPSYNLTWTFHFNDLAKYISMYTDDPQYDLYQNPKFMLMYAAAYPISLVGTHHAQIGDSSSVATDEFVGNYESVKDGFKYLKDSPAGKTLAEYLYLRNGYSEKGFRYDIFTENPQDMEKDILALIDGDISRPSELLSGYGFAVLRDGNRYGDEADQTFTNNMRDFWIWFGPNGKWSHSHQDALNLGIESFGLNMAPDLGYSEASGQLPSRWQWVRATISHNTVVVNEKNQVDTGKRSQYPKHFDDSGEVKLMDIDASDAYAEASIYRRTVVMINAGDDVSYGVDFFRIKGGNDHMYSFHSQSDEIFETEGLGEISYQTDDGTADGNYIGTYAGPDVPYGPDPSNSTSEIKFTYKSGYTWMKDIRQAFNVNKFSIDYNVEDYRKILKDRKGLHIRLTMLNDFELSEVAMTKGHVPPKIENKQLPEQLEYVLARRTGENLDSLFTTVYEPYKGSRYLKSMDAVEITTEEKVGADDTAKAVKVVRTDGRVDYVVYATNNKVIYTVADGNVSFKFRGFVGVYSLNKEGKNIYSYVHDGDILGSFEGDTKAYAGRVQSFTDVLTTENYITIRPNEEFDPSAVIGKYMFIDNDGEENGVYLIKSAETLSDGLIRLGIGMTNVLRGYKDENDISFGYIYNIGKGQKVTIPLSFVENLGPEFVPINDMTASAGSSFAASVKAESFDGASVVYIGATLPRGATLDSESGNIIWKPDSSQVGDNHFAITARDDQGRESTVHFIVKVYGSTTGGGGGSSAPSTPGTSTPTIPATKPDEKDNTSSSTDNVGDGVLDVPQTPGTDNSDANVRFIDLGNHAWAEDAINALADEGIIKGTSENTFSPAANITRADFAILLVRAFKLESENTENFADVADSDYFAKELAIARNTGIVNGIGDNKYAPKNTITRQDMMVIVYRALTKLGVELESADVDYADFAEVADYAKDAVKALITSGLVNGKSGKIAPKDYTTRAEVAVLLKRILDYSK